MTRAARVLIAGAALTGLVAAVTLSGSPLEVIHLNVKQRQAIGTTSHRAEVCQRGEVLPAGTSAIRIALTSVAGPPVRLSVWREGRILTGGTAAGGWTSGAVTVPIAPVRTASAPVQVCFGWGQTAEAITLEGSETGPAEAARTPAGQLLPGKTTLEYMRPASGTWWSRISAVARHMGLGRLPSGTWIAVLAAALTAAAVVGAYRVAWRGLE